MVMEHCAISQCSVSELSFWRWVTQLITTITSEFSASPLSPLLVGITAVGIIGYGWTWRVPTTLKTRWLSSSNKASSPSFIPKDFWPTLKRAIYLRGWETTSILALKRKIKRAQQITVPTILFNTVKVHLAVCSWDSYWVVYGLALN